MAVVFFCKAPAAPKATVEPTAITRPADPTPSAVNALNSTRRHVVKEGKKRFNLAQHYYGNMDKFVELYKANRDVLKSPDQMTPGITLTIPELDATLASSH